MTQGYRPPLDIGDRLWAKCCVTSTGCWEWTGYRNSNGYGVLGLGSRSDATRRVCLVHRVSYEHFVGAISEGLKVLHHCDNPPCFRPIHLFLGTDSDNRADMLAKGRARIVRGSQVGTAKLTEAQVIEIKLRLGHRNDGVLAREFGVSDSLIANIRHGRSWGHVDVLSM